MKNLLASALIVATAMPALANERDGASMQKKVDYYFTKMDSNGDGKISRSEHENFTSDMFAKADSNRDGALSRDELLAQKKQEKEEYKMQHGEKRR